MMANACCSINYLLYVPPAEMTVDETQKELWYYTIREGNGPLLPSSPPTFPPPAGGSVMVL